MGLPGRACPACGQPLYGWLEIEGPGVPALLARCENCRLGLAASLEPDDASRALVAGARRLPEGALELRVANRDSVQARLGAANWAALDVGRRLYPTPESVRLLAGKAGMEIERIRFPRWGQCQVWLWQTLVNAFTFNENFARRARSGRLRPSSFGERVKFALDVLVTVLATPLILLVSVPLELVAALTGRGGVMVVVARPASGRDNGRG